MRKYYQIKTVASAPPRRQIQAGKVICVSGLIITLGSPFIAWLLSVGGSVEKVGVAPDPKRVGPASWNLEHG